MEHEKSKSAGESRDELIDQAMSQTPADDRFRPVDLHLDRKEGLTIRWADGRTSRYGLAYLRQHCPCATCRTKREEESAGPDRAPLSLTVLPANIDRAAAFADAKLRGNYAIQIIWADGHSTGIYDFRYLRAISPVQVDRP